LLAFFSGTLFYPAVDNVSDVVASENPLPAPEPFGPLHQILPPERFTGVI